MYIHVFSIKQLEQQLEHRIQFLACDDDLFNLSIEMLEQLSLLDNYFPVMPGFISLVRKLYCTYNERGIFTSTHSITIHIHT